MQSTRYGCAQVRGVGLDIPGGGAAVDAALEGGEILAGKRAAPGLEAHVDQVGGGDAAPFEVIRGNRHAVWIVVVDDHAQLPGRESRLGKAGDDGVLGRRGMRGGGSISRPRQIRAPRFIPSGEALHALAHQFRAAVDKPE